MAILGWAGLLCLPEIPPRARKGREGEGMRVLCYAVRCVVGLDVATGYVFDSVLLRCFALPSSECGVGGK